MKKITSLLTGCAITLLTASCEKDLPVFSTNDCWLNFAYYDYYNELITSNEEITDEMRTTYYSFITSSAAAGKELQTDTIWLEVTTMGFLSDKDRQIELVQLQTDGRNAIPGQHYEAFDTPSLLEKSVVRAGTNSAFIPIVVKRDASLTQGDVALKLTFKDNGIFKPGYAGMAGAGYLNPAMMGMYASGPMANVAVGQFSASTLLPAEDQMNNYYARPIAAHKKENDN